MADHEIAKRLLDMMAWTVSIPTEKVTVKVERGWVTLSGMVDWDYQRKEAFRAASRVTGVAGVSNLIEVKQHPAPVDVKERIVSAFKRQADLDAAGVTVTTEGGTVKLGGKAWAERGVAERAAWSAPGVTRVEDNITIAL
jgi:osmotically-inducible protein OsmY